VSLLAAVAVGGVLVALGEGKDSVAGIQNGTTSPIVLTPLDSPDSGPKVRMTPEQAQAFKREHHERAHADIEKMTGLVSELNTEFERTNKDEVSVTALHEAREIEKLARDVQSQMKSVSREAGSGDRESGSEAESGLLHVSGGGR